MGQAETRRQEFSLGLPYRWQRLEYMSHHQMPPRVHVNRKLEFRVKQGLDSKCSDTDVGVGVKSQS